MSSTTAIRAGRAFVEIFTRDGALDKGLKNVQRKLKTFAAGVRNVGLKLFGAGTALLAPLALSVGQFAKTGDALDKMANRTGVAVDALSELKFATEQSGSDLETLEKAFFGLSRTMFDAERGSKVAIDALAKLGLTVDDLKGKKPDEQLEIIADAMGRYADVSTRGAIAQQIFGRAGRQLLPLLAGAKGGIQALRAEARALGIVITPEQAKAAADFTDAWNRLKLQLRAVVFQIGGGLAPTLTTLHKVITPILKTAIDWAARNKALVTTIAAVGAALVAAGGALLAFSFGVTAAAFVVGALVKVLALLAAVVGFLLTPLGLSLGLFAAFVAWLLRMEHASGRLAHVFRGMGDALRTALGGIEDALLGGNLELALEILVVGLKLIWKQFTGWLVNSFVDAFNKLIGNIAAFVPALLGFLPGDMGREFHKIAKELQKMKLIEWDFQPDVAALEAELDRLRAEAAAGRPEGKDGKPGLGDLPGAAQAGTGRIFQTYSAVVARRWGLGETRDTRLEMQRELNQTAKQIEDNTRRALNKGMQFGP